jgi:hypothetical protein
MTNEQINIAIAEACGWNPPPEGMGNITHGGSKFMSSKEWRKVHIPNYCNDLNVMHEAERASTIFKSWRATKEWMDNLCICSNLGRLPESAPDWSFVLRASAAQRAKAFLRTLGKWEGAK